METAPVPRPEEQGPQAQNDSEHLPMPSSVDAEVATSNDTKLDLPVEIPPHLEPLRDLIVERALRSASPDNLLNFATALEYQIYEIDILFARASRAHEAA